MAPYSGSGNTGHRRAFGSGGKSASPDRRDPNRRRVEAVTIGEYARTNSKETALVHVEKAANQYRGLYQAINNEFCLRLPEETIYVNREEDMGMENLRQTKLSYKPFQLAEKYSAVVK